MPEVIDPFGCEEDDALDDDENVDTLYLKYCFEGAQTLPELAAMLRGLADDVEHRAADGWRIEGDVENGWAHLVRDDQGEGDHGDLPVV